MKKTTRYIVVNAAVAALYVALTVPFGALATNPFVQIRPGEALTVLPLVMPCTIVGLTVGCAVGNLVSSFGLWDILLGSLVTCVAAFATSKAKKDWLAPLPPVLLNAFLLPLVWILAATDAPTFTTYALQVGGLLLSQSAVCFGLGLPLLSVAKKRILPMLADDVSAETTINSDQENGDKRN